MRSRRGNSGKMVVRRPLHHAVSAAPTKLARRQVASTSNPKLRRPRPTCRARKREARQSGYRVDFAKLKLLCHQAGLTLVDLYEPGTFPRKLISEAALKKWRRGGRARAETLTSIAAALSTWLHFRVEWRDLVQADPIPSPTTPRYVVVSLHAEGSAPWNGLVASLRNSIVARLSKVSGVRLLAPRARSIASRAPLTVFSRCKLCSGSTASIAAGRGADRSHDPRDLWAEAYTLAAATCCVRRQRRDGHRRRISGPLAAA